MAASVIKPAHRIAAEHPERVAIRDINGSHSYGDVLAKAVKLSALIQKSIGHSRTQERIGFLCPNDVTYVVAQWACWASGHIAVPLSPLHPPSLLSYYLQDCNAALVVASRSHSKLLAAVQESVGKTLPSIELEESFHRQQTAGDGRNSDTSALLQETRDLNFYRTADAMILYTSGTTGKPKGVLLSHENLDAQVRMLLPIWRWTKRDVIVHALPLHHTHGVVNALLCPLFVGARCIMLPKFDAGSIWKNFIGEGMGPEDKPTIFMGVPTMYTKLLDYYDAHFANNPSMRDYVRAACLNNLRVMISGSAALPEPVFHKWQSFTGHHIVERYGMTEIGTVLSIPYEGERRAGYVGVLSPGVSLRLAEFQPSPKGIKGDYKVVFETSHEEQERQKAGRAPSTSKSGLSGDLLIKGPNVFKCYWNKPEATDKDFTSDGWFRTGDAVQFDDGYIKILGRLSADIIKSGGYKISALEIETHLLGHPLIADATVVGIPDPTWGQRVAAALVLKDPKGPPLDLLALKAWCKERMAPYMVPTEWRFYGELPRNALGKVNKVEFAKTAFAAGPSSKL